MRKILYNLIMGGSIINLFFQVLPISIFFTLIYLVARTIYVRKKQIKISKAKEIIYAIFICYLIGIANLILVPQNFWTMIWYYIFNGYNGVKIGSLINLEFNLIPSLFKVISGDLILGSWVLEMIIFNVLMFVPMGFFLGMLKCEKNKNIYIFFILIPLFIEIMQIFIGRSFDIDDIICNFFGIVIGYFVIEKVKKVLH